MNDDVTYLCSVGVIRSKDSAEISNTKKVVVEILKTTQKKRAWKKLEFQFVLWASNALIFLAHGLSKLMI